MAVDDEVKKLRSLLATGPHISQRQLAEAPGLASFLDAIRELLPPVLDEIERATGQEKQTSEVLGGFVGDLERAQNAQVPTEIHCPLCGALHVDQDEWATTRLHRKHLCHSCGHVWAPYPVTTVGVDFHVKCRESALKERQAFEERIYLLNVDVGWLKNVWSESVDKINELYTRRDELLQTIANLSQSVPLDDEVAHALERQGALLAEIGTLKARIAELERDRGQRSEYVNMATEYDGTDYG